MNGTFTGYKKRSHGKLAKFDKALKFISKLTKR